MSNLGPHINDLRYGPLVWWQANLTWGHQPWDPWKGVTGVGLPGRGALGERGQQMGDPTVGAVQRATVRVSLNQQNDLLERLATSKHNILDAIGSTPPNSPRADEKKREPCNTVEHLRFTVDEHNDRLESHIEGLEYILEILRGLQ